MRTENFFIRSLHTYIRHKKKVDYINGADNRCVVCGSTKEIGVFLGKTICSRCLLPNRNQQAG